MENIQEPIEEKSSMGVDAVKTKHPAFGQITLHRTSGARGALYGSDFVHNAAITIRIHNSTLHRTLNNDYHFAEEAFTEIEMSEAQWATFVSSQGLGSGVPCTIRMKDGKRQPYLPKPRDRVDQFNDELLDDFKRILERCDALMEGAKTKKQKDEIALLKQDLEKNLPFVAKQFGEHMEKTVESAKAEVHGYMTGAIQRAGLSVLGEPAPLLLTQDKGDENSEEDTD